MSRPGTPTFVDRSASRRLLTASGLILLAFAVDEELRNRGVRDVLIVCCDGLTGFPEAIEATWPQTTVRTCVVHLLTELTPAFSHFRRVSATVGREDVFLPADEK
jgi:hypothetical protein